MKIPEELLERTRVKAYTTLIAICDDTNQPGEIRLQAALSLLAATEREGWIDQIEQAGGEPGDLGIDAHTPALAAEQV